MELLVFRHLWGVDPPWEPVYPQIKTLRYVGIEVAISLIKDRSAFIEMLQENRFHFIPMIFTEGKSVDEHIVSFKKQVDEAVRFNPIHITCHSGRDFFTEDGSFRFFQEALKYEADAGVSVAHETHRGRIFYNPWITAKLLDRFIDLKLCCDFSHWVCVCERLIDDQIEIIKQCAEHAIHIHARVGYMEGPQVPDPRAAEYKNELEAHERWWSIVWAAQKQRGAKYSTLTPEFGPPPYLHTLAHTNVPVADLWDVCNWQAQRQREHFRKMA